MSKEYILTRLTAMLSELATRQLDDTQEAALKFMVDCFHKGREGD